MKKSLLMLAVASSFVMADEGMWMPQQLPQIATELKTAGLALNPADLTKLTEFPAAAIVSLGGCSASFVSPNGLVATNHHCVYNSIAHNSTAENDLLKNGFLAKTLAEEVPAAPGSRIFVTGHPEYDLTTLDEEYQRDLAAGVSAKLPENYYRQNDPLQGPQKLWQSHAFLLFSNWLNYYVYQATPFDIQQIGQ